ncbi:MAG: hypothetical protein VX444_01570 [Pseudomonadota bacterium]|nr:hypothetical protein [Pseudomonadota bacterium]
MSADVVVVVLVAASVAAIGLWYWLFVLPVRTRRKEIDHLRASLRFDPETGLFHWTSLNGHNFSSETNPDEAGGAWEQNERDALEQFRS